MEPEPRTTMPTSNQLGRYRLLERIAVGGSAEVFRAAVVHGDGSEEPLVLKRVLPQHASDPRFARLFREEALVVASLEHDNIVRLRDFGEMQGTLFLALEYVDGASLDRLLQPSGPQLRATTLPALAAAVALQVCAALDYIHGRCSSAGTPLGIVHRDISPHNILVSTTGVVKLADFGIARSVIREDRTFDGTIKGKLAYMSPEQATPGAPLDARSDLFSLGSVLHEALLGRSPFEGKDEIETLDRVRGCRLELDEEQLAPEHRLLVPVLRRCLQRDPAARYASAGELGGELRGYLATLAAPPGRSEIAEWVERARREAPARGVGGLLSELLGEGGPRSSTAVLARAAVQGEPARVLAAPGERARHKPGPRRRRSRSAARLTTVLQMVLVAVVTATVTLGLALHLARRPSTQTVAPGVQRQPAAEPLGAADAAIVAATAASRPTATVPARKRPLGLGRLTVNSIPWAEVYLDGRPIGITPIRGRAVPAGQHRVVLRDGRGRLLRSFSAHIRAGHNSVFSFDHRAP
jgi:hypothetical protein